jgi:hypothetical protein
VRLTKFHDFIFDGGGAQTQHALGTYGGLVSLYGGGFDTQGGAINLQPRQIGYTFELTEGDSTIREQIDDFMAAVMHGRGLLHGIDRDETRVQTWAKVTSVNMDREAGSAGVQAIEVTFEMPYPYWLNTDDEPATMLDDSADFDGSWTFSYGNTTTDTITGTSETVTINNTGPIAIPRNLIIIKPRSGASLGAFTLHNTTNHHEFEFGDSLAAEETLYIDTLSKTIHIDGTDAYDDLTVGDRQRLWMVLDAGSNSIDIDSASVSGTVDLTWCWSRHYVL